jgi:enterobactin synthetase component D
MVRGTGCKADARVWLSPVSLSLASSDDCHIVAAELLDMSGAPGDAHGIAADARTIAVPAALRGAAAARLAGFVAGRYCATRALTLAGCDGDVEIAMGPDRAPVWPKGFVGTITHSNRFVIAAAARRSAVRAVGIDCEALIAEATVEEIAPRLLTPMDRATFERDAAAHLDWCAFVTLVFSAKESLYKCLQPLTGVFFDFSDAQVSAVDIRGRRLTHQLVRSLTAEFAGGAELFATFCVSDDHVCTVVELAAAFPARGHVGSSSVATVSSIESGSVR